MMAYCSCTSSPSPLPWCSLGLLPPPAEMKVTEEQMKAARLDVSYRDYCAHLLIPLNKCRKETFYLPFKCGHERHEYEKCQYVEHLRQQKTKMEA